MEGVGRWIEAAHCHSRAFVTALQLGDVSAAVDSLRGKARALVFVEEFELGEEAATLSLAIAERNGLDEAAARAVNILAFSRYRQRDWNGAHALFEEAFERALDTGDDEMVGYACQNLGVVANILGHLREARVRYLESIGSAVRSGRKSNEAASYNNLGIVCADLGDWMESVLYFDRGIEIAERTGNLAETARLYANRAEPLLSVGDFAEAQASLNRAEEIATQINARVTLADIARYRGKLLRLQGRLAAADQELQRALQITEEAALPLSRAETLEEIGRLRREEARGSESRAAFEESRSLFAELGAIRDVDRLDGLLAEQEQGPA